MASRINGFINEVPIAIGQSNWPAELDLEELFFHLRAKGNEVQSKTYVISAKGGAW